MSLNGFLNPSDPSGPSVTQSDESGTVGMNAGK